MSYIPVRFYVFSVKEDNTVDTKDISVNVDKDSFLPVLKALFHCPFSAVHHDTYKYYSMEDIEGDIRVTLPLCDTCEDTDINGVCLVCSREVDNGS